MALRLLYATDLVQYTRNVSCLSVYYQVCYFTYSPVTSPSSYSDAAPTRTVVSGSNSFMMEPSASAHMSYSRAGIRQRSSSSCKLVSEGAFGRSRYLCCTVVVFIKTSWSSHRWHTLRRLASMPRAMETRLDGEWFARSPGASGLALIGRCGSLHASS